MFPNQSFASKPAVGKGIFSASETSGPLIRSGIYSTDTLPNDVFTNRNRDPTYLFSSPYKTTPSQSFYYLNTHFPLGSFPAPSFKPATSLNGRYNNWTTSNSLLGSNSSATTTAPSNGFKFEIKTSSDGLCNTTSPFLSNTATLTTAPSSDFGFKPKTASVSHYNHLTMTYSPSGSNTVTATTASSTNLYGTSTNLYGTPTNLYGTPTNLYGTSTNLYGTPTNLYGTSTNLYGSNTGPSSDSVYGANKSWSGFYNNPITTNAPLTSSSSTDFGTIATPGGLFNNPSTSNPPFTSKIGPSGDSTFRTNTSTSNFFNNPHTTTTSPFAPNNGTSDGKGFVTIATPGGLFNNPSTTNPPFTSNIGPSGDSTFRTNTSTSNFFNNPHTTISPFTPKNGPSGSTGFVTIATPGGLFNNPSTTNPPFTSNISPSGDSTFRTNISTSNFFNNPHTTTTSPFAPNNRTSDGIGFETNTSSRRHFPVITKSPFTLKDTDASFSSNLAPGITGSSGFVVGISKSSGGAGWNTTSTSGAFNGNGTSTSSASGDVIQDTSTNATAPGAELLDVNNISINGDDVHERVLAATSSPYPDADLYKDLETAQQYSTPTRTHVGVAVPTTVETTYRVTSPATRLKVTPLPLPSTQKTQPGGDSGDTLSLTPTRKRLVLRPKPDHNSDRSAVSAEGRPL